MKISAVRIPYKNLQEAEAFYSGQLALHKAFGPAAGGFIGYQLENVQRLLEEAESYI